MPTGRSNSVDDVTCDGGPISLQLAGKMLATYSFALASTGDILYRCSDSFIRSTLRLPRGFGSLVVRLHYLKKIWHSLGRNDDVCQANSWHAILLTALHFLQSLLFRSPINKGWLHLKEV